MPVATGVSPSFSGGASFVSMMETADLWNRDDPSALRRLHGPRFRRVLTKREVCSGFMIVRHERPDVPMQRGFVEDYDVVQALAPNRSDHALHVCPLPGRSWRRKHLPDAHFLGLSGEIVAKDAIPIAQKIAWRRFPWECIAELLASPFRSGMSGDTEALPMLGSVHTGCLGPGTRTAPAPGPPQLRAARVARFGAREDELVVKSRHF
jgi:hypothetical protein